MRIHNVDVQTSVADSILDGECGFYVAINDPQYQKGDHIVFRALDGMCYDSLHRIRHKEYEITYVMTHHGLKERFVAFGFAEIGGES